MNRSHIRPSRDEAPGEPKTTPLTGCIIPSDRYGRIVKQRGYEKHGPHILPLARFAGGALVAMYCARDATGTWRHVYSRASSPTTAPASAPASASASRN